MLNIRSGVNYLIVGSILAIIYLFVGHGFVKFYTGGQTEILNMGEKINKLCNVSGSCPTTLDGWYQSLGNPNMLTKENMVYFVSAGEENDKSKSGQSFRLVYGFFMPDDWFEVQGGVGKQVTSDWKSR